MPARSLLVAVGLLLAPAGLRAADPPKLPPAAGRAVDFDRDVKPILAEHCWKCHGPDKQKGGLRLDSRKAVLAGGDSGPVVVERDSAESHLIAAVAGTDPNLTMPPGAKRLTPAQVGILRAWIDQGVAFPEQKAAPPPARKSDHWAFQPVRRPPVPNPSATARRVRNPIDAFVFARMEKERIAPSPEADKVTLCRRLYFDLIGLPPTPEEVEAFLKDTSPDPYGNLVDRLLASPHYGERWGRHWLDAARYADSDGYEKDTARPFAWRYRDWVIAALNRDLPFDQFTVEQLAGDLLPNATLQQKIATGFHRNTLTNKEGGVDQEEFRVAAVMDRVNTTGKVWLGLTVGCCQCHDHKYDPLTQREYYQLLAFFNSDREVDLPAPLPGEENKLRRLAPAEKAEWEKLKAAVQQAREQNLSSGEMIKREKALAAFEAKHATPSKAPTLALGPRRPTHVMLRGDFLRKGVEVNPGTPAVLPPLSKADPTRLDLARWLVAPENPLTPRVTVNWVWAKYFGRGLVATPEDFGTQGEKPSHPELLDWLASEFRGPAGCNWSLKRLHKLIVTSAAYRQSSAARPDLADRDPLNVLLARQVRLRLEAEIIRDSALAASGLLTRTVGGPSVRPPQPPGISELTYANSAKWVESTGPDRYRRGLYVWFQRTSPYPMLTTFDEPDSNVCAVRRERSNTPLQALTLLNDAVFVEAAQALAKRVLTEKADEPNCERVEHAVRLCLAREPTDAETKRLLKLHADLRKLMRADPAAAAKLVGKYRPAGEPVEEAAAWVALCRALLNLDEFITRE